MVVTVVALSTAWANLQDIGSSGKASDIEVARYAHASDPWLEALLRRTWLEIWIEMLRDEIFVDTTDYLTAYEFAVAIRSLTLSPRVTPGLGPPK